MGLKQARSWFRFPAWVLCFGCHVFSSARCSGNFAGSRCVTSPGKLSPPLKSLSSWRYGFGHGLRLLWLVLLWESSGPASRSALRAFERAVTSSGAPESCKERRERARGRASSFQLSGLDAAHRRLIESDCPYGAEPRPRPGLLLQGILMWWKE